LIALVFALLALVLTAAAFSYAHETARLNALVQERDEAERKAQAHRDEHLSARARSGYLELIRKYAETYNINPSLVSAIIKCESSFDPAAVSRVEARGLMQIMPGTGVDIARWLGITDYASDNLFNPEFNIRFGTYYLARLSDQFDGNPVMVTAAFHAGDGNVKRWALDHAADMKTLTLDMIPMDDTRSYVRKVMDAYAIYYTADSTDQTGALPGAVPDAGSIRGARNGY
jgi:soluble lytic murein transglycosylase